MQPTAEKVNTAPQTYALRERIAENKERDVAAAQRSAYRSLEEAIEIAGAVQRWKWRDALRSALDQLNDGEHRVAMQIARDVADAIETHAGLDQDDEHYGRRKRRRIKDRDRFEAMFDHATNADRALHVLAEHHDPTPGATSVTYFAQTREGEVA